MILQIWFSAKSVEQHVRSGLLVFIDLGDDSGSSVNGELDDGGSMGCACEHTVSN